MDFHGLMLLPLVALRLPVHTCRNALWLRVCTDDLGQN